MADKPARGEKRAAPAEVTADDAAEQPSLVPAEVIEERRQRKQAIRGENTERKAKAEEHAPRPRREDRPRRDDRSERPDRTEQNRRQRERDDDGTVGFGDDMPAFMRVTGKV